MAVQGLVSLPATHLDSSRGNKLSRLALGAAFAGQLGSVPIEGTRLQAENPTEGMRASIADQRVLS